MCCSVGLFQDSSRVRQGVVSVPPLAWEDLCPGVRLRQVLLSGSLGWH